MLPSYQTFGTSMSLATTLIRVEKVQRQNVSNQNIPGLITSAITEENLVTLCLFSCEVRFVNKIHIHFRILQRS